SIMRTKTVLAGILKWLIPKTGRDFARLWPLVLTGFRELTTIDVPGTAMELTRMPWKLGMPINPGVFGKNN
ncbi:MAG: hypothetical protein K6U00_06665, partial [Armatimonadetes bacterium]|nr:hypothetical protein [Armatimonadota bacterium]